MTSGSSRLIDNGGADRRDIAAVEEFVAWFATMLTGTSLTAKGRVEREMWLDYAGWLRTNSQLHTVGAPGVATWREPLIYATVLGAAPKAAAALGTR